MGWLLDHFGWGAWGPSMIGFAGIGAVLMLTLWDATPTNTVVKVETAPAKGAALEEVPA